MKVSQRLRAERAFVEKVLGDSVICQRCQSTLGTYADACTADLSDPCEGFMAVEKSRAAFGETQRDDYAQSCTDISDIAAALERP